MEVSHELLGNIFGVSKFFRVSVTRRMKKSVLFVSHFNERCGIYQFGRSISQALNESSRYHFEAHYSRSLSDIKDVIKRTSPSAIIYNYNPITLPHLASSVLGRVSVSHIALFSIPQIGIIHEVTQEIADAAIKRRGPLFWGGPQEFIRTIFDHYIAPDPTLQITGDLVSKTGRLIPSYTKSEVASNKRIRVGSFGFATPQKGFERVVTQVQNEFDSAEIVLNIPPSDFGDPDGRVARDLANRCQALIFKKDIKLTVTHDFLNESELLDFLGQNTVNVFLYEAKEGRGISSVLDYALAVGRPIALSDSSMFRHVLREVPSVNLYQSSLSRIISSGDAILEPLRVQWTAANIRKDYESIIDRVLDDYR